MSASIYINLELVTLACVTDLMFELGLLHCHLNQVNFRVAKSCIKKKVTRTMLRSWITFFHESALMTMRERFHWCPNGKMIDAAPDMTSKFASYTSCPITVMHYCNTSDHTFLSYFFQGFTFWPFFLNTLCEMLGRKSTIKSSLKCRAEVLNSNSP